MEELSLAPAAGAGVGKKLAERLLARDDFMPLMEAAAIDGLQAMAPRRWDKDTQDWITDPDMKTRTAVFFGLIANMEGEPVKRIIHQHVGGGGRVDLVQSLHDSPALLDAAKAMIAKAEHRTLKPAREEKKARKVALEQVGEVLPQSQ